MKKPLCILLIHGFGGTSAEVTPLAQLLGAQGYHCRIAALAGHEDGLPKIAHLPWRAWVDSVKVLREQLDEDYRVLPVGFSMGGLITAVLNSQKSFEQIVFINTPIYFWNVPQILKNICGDFRYYFRYYFIKSAGRVAFYSMVQFFFLLLHARPLFAQVACPALVVQAADDDSVWPCSAGFITKKLKGRATLLRVSGSGHQALLSPDECAQICDAITQACSSMLKK